MSKFIRYIGSKEAIFDFLINNFNKYCPNFESFGDLFSGTNIVSSNLIKYEQIKSIQSFDMSRYSEALSSFVNPNIDNEFIDYLKELDKLPLIEGDIFNEFSINGKPKTIDFKKFDNQKVKSRLFFPEKIGKKIDTVKKRIVSDYNNSLISLDTLNKVLSLLLKFADSNANTTGVYGAYLKNEVKKERSFLSEDLISELLSLSKFDKDFKFKRSSILESISNIKYCDIIYLDPPYTTRRYETNYHILEYIADINFNIEKIKYNTKAGTPDLSLIKNPFGGKNTTYKIFEEMIVRGVEKCKYLFISYSNQGFMKESDIREICNKYKLVLETESIKHKKYKSHGNDVQGELFEILWVIKKSDNI